MQCECAQTLGRAWSVLRNLWCRLWGNSLIEHAMQVCPHLGSSMYHHSALYLRFKHALLPCRGSRLKSSGRLSIDNAMPVGPHPGSSMQCAKEHSHIFVCRECFQGFFWVASSFWITKYHTLLRVSILVLVDTLVS